MVFKEEDLSKLGKPFIGKYEVPIYGMERVNCSSSEHFLIYEMFNLTNGKYYVGRHKTTEVNDFYFGSGTILKQAKAKYGLKAFVKIILADFRTEDEMDLAEFATIQIENCSPHDPMSYNIFEGGRQPRLTEARKEQNRIDSSNRRWMKDPKTGESHFVPREEMTAYFAKGYVLGRTLDERGDKNPIHYHTFTEEECLSRRNRTLGPNNPMYGKHLKEVMTSERYASWREAIKGHQPVNHGKWIVNNGYENKWVDPGCIPEGYVRGYCARSKLNPKNQAKNPKT